MALMKDQVAAMSKREVKAVFVGDCGQSEQDFICEGKYQIVYMSPEALLTDMRWRDMLLSPTYINNLVGLIVDEAHCVKKWYVHISISQLKFKIATIAGVKRNSPILEKPEV